MDDMNRLKCVLVGDYDIGISSLSLTFHFEHFPTDLDIFYYRRFDHSNDVENITVDGRNFQLSLLDTSDYALARPHRLLLYHEANVFLVCFSLVDPESFKNVKEYWVPEVRHFGPNTPIVLVGTKQDLRDDKECMEKFMKENIKPVSYDEGLSLSKEMQAATYIECSSHLNKGVTQVFEEAIRAAINPPPPQKKTSRKCQIM